MLYTAFVVSSITEDNSIGDKIDSHNVQLLEELLNARLQLAAYGPGVKGIGVVFLGTAPEDGIHEEERSFDASTGEVKRLWVHGSARGQGLARRLMTAIETEARTMGLTKLKLDTNSALSEALALYRAMGWRETAPYTGTPADVWLEKPL